MVFCREEMNKCLLNATLNQGIPVVKKKKRRKFCSVMAPLPCLFFRRARSNKCLLKARIQEMVHSFDPIGLAIFLWTKNSPSLLSQPAIGYVSVYVPKPIVNHCPDGLMLIRASTPMPPLPDSSTIKGLRSISSISG